MIKRKRVLSVPLFVYTHIDIRAKSKTQFICRLTFGNTVTTSLASILIFIFLLFTSRMTQSAWSPCKTQKNERHEPVVADTVWELISPRLVVAKAELYMSAHAYIPVFDYRQISDYRVHTLSVRAHQKKFAEIAGRQERVQQGGAHTKSEKLRQYRRQ